MSGSDRSDGATGLGHWGYFLAILLACLLVGLIAFSQGRETERRDTSPHNHAESAKAYAQRACVGADAAATFECIYDAVEASDETARAEQDLSAQQWMALWALVMAIISAITAIVTGIGVWYVKRTLDATLVAVKGTNDATAAMIKSNDIALNAQRAWVDVSAELLQFEIDERGLLLCSCKAKFQNTGQMIAEEMSVKTRMFVEPKRFIGRIEKYFDQFLRKPDPATIEFIPGQVLELPSKIYCAVEHMRWDCVSDIRSDSNLVFLAMARYRVSGDTTWRYTLRSFLIGEFRDHVDSRNIIKETIYSIGMDDVRITPIGISRAT